jgi:hypothetical protein
MIESAVRDRDVPMDIVNLEPDELGERIAGFGTRAITPIGGSACISEFTHKYRDRAAQALVHTLEGLDPSDRGGSLLLTRRSQDPDTSFFTVGEMLRERDGVLVLIADKARDPSEMISGQPSGSDRLPNLGDLIAMVRGAKKLVVRRDGTDSVVVGYSRIAHHIVRGDWFILIPV